MQLERRIQALIAVGASIATNCQPCLQSTVALALRSGADEQQIVDAIQVAKGVREGAASNMDKFAADLNHAVLSSATVIASGCECNLA